MHGGCGFAHECTGCIFTSTANSQTGSLDLPRYEIEPIGRGVFRTETYRSGEASMCETPEAERAPVFRPVSPPKGNPTRVDPALPPRCAQTVAPPCDAACYR